MARPLGQHFLVNDSILETIARLAQDGSCSHVMEIGAGKGALTHHLARFFGKVVSVEIDTTLQEDLAVAAGNLHNVEILWGDFLKTRETDIVSRLGDDYCVAGNVPYYITTDIVKQLLWDYEKPRHITLLMQKEAAERLCAEHHTKDYGPLPIEIALAWESEIPLEVPPEAFLPPPHVDSAVLVLSRKADAPCEEDLAHVRKLTRCAFTRRRKQLPGILGGAGVEKEEAAAALQALGLSPKARPEELTPQDWLAFSRKLRGQ